MFLSLIYENPIRQRKFLGYFQVKIIRFLPFFSIFGSLEHLVIIIFLNPNSFFSNFYFLSLIIRFLPTIAIIDFINLLLAVGGPKFFESGRFLKSSFFHQLNAYLIL